MRVALVSPYDLTVPGGVQAQVSGLGAELAARGHQVTMLGAASTRVLRMRVNGSVAPLVLDRLPALDVDVVHVHEPVTPLCWRAFGGEVPVVATFHADVTPGIARAIRVAAPGLRRRLRGVPTTAVSEVAAAPWRAIGLDPVVIPNGVGSVDTTGVVRDRRRVVFVGRDEPRKGLAVLLTAWTQVRRHLPDAELTVVGVDGADEPGLRWVGRVDEATKWDILAGAGVVCAPNVGNESFGIVGVEAMVSGCALVASDLPAFRAVIGDAGRFATPGDPASLAARLTEVVGDDAVQVRLASAGRQRAHRYRWDRVADAYLERYERATPPRRLNRR